LANFLLLNLKFLPEGALFMPACPSKQRHIGKPLKEFFFPAFEVNPNLCPVNAIKVYNKKLSMLGNQKVPFSSQLSLTTTQLQQLQLPDRLIQSWH